MTSQYRHRRTSNPATAFPSPLEPGEIAVNTANRQLAVGDANSSTIGTPLPFLAIRYFDVRAIYVTSDYVIQAGVLYRALNGNGPGAFSSSDWEGVSGTLLPQYVQKAGDTMTGVLNLAADPTSATQAANKHYVDTQLALKSSVIVSDTPPVGAIDNTLWFESDTGFTYLLFNDGSSRQWILQGGPPADTSQFVQRAGDTMTGVLVAPSFRVGTDLSASAPNKIQVQSSSVPSHLLVGQDTTHYGAFSWMYDPTPANGALALATASYHSAITIDGSTLLLNASSGGPVLVPTPPAGNNTSSAANTTWVNAALPRKNYIINGAMMVSQENGNAAGSGSNYYAADMWRSAVILSSGALSVAQVASLTPAGSPNRIRHTVTTAEALAAADFVSIFTKIEGLRAADLAFGAAAARSIILRFGVKAPAGTYALSFSNAAQNRVYLAEFTISSGEANTDVVKSVSIPGDVAGTWATDNNVGLQVLWSLACGSDNATSSKNAWVNGNAVGTTTQSNFMASAGNVFELFDVGLYAGAVAPPFVVPDYIGELSASMRYWQRLTNWIVDQSTSVFSITLPIRMRAAPTFAGGATGFSASGFADGQTGYVTQSAGRGIQTLTCNARI